MAIIQLLRGLMDEKRMQFGPLAGLADPKPATVIHAQGPRAGILCSDGPLADGVGEGALRCAVIRGWASRAARGPTADPKPSVARAMVVPEPCLR